MASASRCGFSTTDRKSAPRTRTSAAIAFSSFSNAIGAPTSENVTTDWLYLAGYGVAFFAIAVWAYRREESRKFS